MIVSACEGKGFPPIDLDGCVITFVGYGLCIQWPDGVCVIEAQGVNPFQFYDDLEEWHGQEQNISQTVTV